MLARALPVPAARRAWRQLVSAPGRLSTAALAAYAAPGLGLALLVSPFPSLIAAFYAQYTAATAAGIAIAASDGCPSTRLSFA